MDKILLGGLQLPMYSSSVSRNNKTQGIIITLKGCKGTDKTMLAMQVMHGITKSLRRYNGEDALLAPAFYSLDKMHDQLNDILLDFIISQCTRKMIKLKQDLRKDSQYNNSLFADIIFKTDQKYIPVRNSVITHRYYRMTFVPVLINIYLKVLSFTISVRTRCILGQHSRKTPKPICCLKESIILFINISVM